jgi:hypothetical protein
MNLHAKSGFSIFMPLSRFNVPVIFCLLWLAVVGLGIGAISRYERTPGKTGAPPPSWPAEAGVARDEHLPTLLVFAHPQCPCTRATIEELNRMLVKCRGRVAVRVMFMTPEDAREEWTRSNLWKSAAAIPGVSVEIDGDGKIARKFGVETSGHAVLYDAHGALLFQGGITASRGHVGGNAGEVAILSRLLAGTAGADRTAVFGCSLFNSKREPTERAD